MSDLLSFEIFVLCLLTGRAIGAALTYYFPLGFRSKRKHSTEHDIAELYVIKPIIGKMAYDGVR